MLARSSRCNMRKHDPQCSSRCWAMSVQSSRCNLGKHTFRCCSRCWAMLARSSRFQYAKAPSPMLFTLLGNVSSVKPLQYAKAPSPMLFTLLGNVSSANLPCNLGKHTFRCSFTLLGNKFGNAAATIESMIPDSRHAVWQCYSVKPLQYAKAPSPMLFTLLGNVSSVKPLQPQKARPSILATLSGNVSLVKLLQYAKAQASTTPHTIGQCQFSQACATLESIPSDALRCWAISSSVKPLQPSNADSRC